MKKAFTLIELLIVVAIIAILMALAFPVFTRARESARRSQCISNLQQLGTAIDLYCQDWDDKYPWAWNETFFDNDQVKFAPCMRQCVNRYVRIDAIWRCHSDTGETWPLMQGGYEKRTPPLYTFPAGSSYLWLGLGADAVLPGRQASALKRPNIAILLQEIRPWHAVNRPDDSYFTSNGLFNVLYCDQHVAQQTYTQIYADRCESIHVETGW